jgi:PST family polysaccharide transporter
MIEKLGLYMIPNLIRNRSVQNFIFLLTIQASNILISLISVPLLIQSIGLDQFGLVNLSLSVIVLANILVGFGYNLSAPREVALSHGDKNRLSHLVSNIVSGRVLLAFLASSLILLAALGGGMFSEYKWILVFSLLLLFSEATLPVWFFQGLEKMKLVSLANVFSKLLYLAAIVLVIHEPSQSKWVNFLMGISGLSINLLLLAYIHFQLEIKFLRPDFGKVIQSIRQNWLLFLSNVASYLSVNGGLIILSFFAQAEVLGMFSLAEKIAIVLRLFPSMLVQAVFPNASRLYAADQNSYHRYSRKIYGIGLLCGLGLTLLIFATAPLIISLLAKKPLPESVEYLRVLAFVPFLAVLNFPNVLLLLVKDQKKLLFRSSWLLAIYVVPACFWLTAKYGAMGLCFGLISAEVVSLIVGTMFNRLYNREDFFRLIGFRTKGD